MEDHHHPHDQYENLRKAIEEQLTDYVHERKRLGRRRILRSLGLGLIVGGLISWAIVGTFIWSVPVDFSVGLLLVLGSFIFWRKREGE